MCVLVSLQNNLLPEPRNLVEGWQNVREIWCILRIFVAGNYLRLRRMNTNLPLTPGNNAFIYTPAVPFSAAGV